MTDEGDEDDLASAEELRTRRGSKRGRTGRGRTSNSGDSDNSDNSSNDYNTTNSSEAGNSAQSSDSDNSDNSTGVREKTHVPIYLDDEHLSMWKAFRSQMQAEHIQATGDELEWNRDLYPAIIRALSENPDVVRDELGLDED